MKWEKIERISHKILWRHMIKDMYWCEICGGEKYFAPFITFGIAKMKGPHDAS